MYNFQYNAVESKKTLEIVNSSEPRQSKLTWKQYFRKKYMTTLILTISITAYVYYLYKPIRKANLKIIENKMLYN